MPRVLEVIVHSYAEHVYNPMYRLPVHLFFLLDRGDAVVTSSAREQKTTRYYTHHQTARGRDCGGNDP
eukprot:gene13380-9207_t